jgi:hypothetical protein
MFDEQEFQKKFFSASSDKLKSWSTSSSSTNRAPFLPTSKLENGTYICRILPPFPGRCTNGWLKVAIHWVHVNLGDEKSTRFECVKDEDTPCYICEILETLADEKERLMPRVRDVLEKMRAIPKLVLPAIINAEAVTPGQFTTMFRKSPTYHGAMLEITARGLQEKVFTLLHTDKFFTHPDKGRYFFLNKNHNVMDIKVTDSLPPGPISTEQRYLLEDKAYPKMESAYFNKNVHRFNYADQQKALENAWWMQDSIVKEALSANFYDDPTSSTEESAEEILW